MFADLLFAAAAAASTPTTASPQSEQGPAKQERLVCKSAKFAGSNISQRICKTRAEWDEARRRAQEQLDNMHNRGVDGEALFPKGPG
jgi:hypothetical protein